MTTEMTAKTALEIVKNAIIAAAYLEAAAQVNIDADGKVIADAVAAKEHVEARTIAGSYKTFVSATKFGRAAEKMVKFGESVVALEAKQGAITTTATNKVKELALTGKSK